MPNFPAARLRPATPADRPFLERLFFAIHADEFAPLNLPPQQLEPLLAMQARAQRESYARDFPTAIDRIILTEAAEPIGRILVDERADRIELVDIALLAEARNAGTGEAVLRDVMVRAEQLGRPVRLQVRPGNRAFHLYTRLGFTLRAAATQLELEWTPAGLTPSTEPAPKKQPQTEWDDAVGSIFEVETAPPGQAAPLHLQSLHHHPAGGFALNFTGALERQIAQGTWLLRHAPDDAGQWVFLVPIGPHEGQMQYEAVFNS